MQNTTRSVLAAFVLVLSAAPADAQKCEAAKLLAFGKHYDCTMVAQAKAVKSAGKIALPGQPKCGDAMTLKWAKAEALGSGPLAVPFAAEDKTTTDSNSTYFFHPIANTEGELRLTRVGDDFSMYYRPISDPTWQLLGSATRADLPPTLQLGLMAYDFNASPDLTVSFDEVLFE